MLRTYDIEDADMEIIKHVLSQSPFHVQREMGERIKPTCDADERLVFSVQAFRDFWDTSDEDIAWALETADDELIGTFLGDDPLYEGWAKMCESTMTELLHHLNKLKAGEGGLTLPTREEG